MKLQSTYNPQRTSSVQKTAKSPQLTVTPRLLNSIKAAPKGQLPKAFTKYAKPMLPTNLKKAKSMPKRGTF